jgi:hypothetical protein
MDKNNKKDEIYWNFFENTGSIHAFLLYLSRRSDIAKRISDHKEIPPKAMKEISSSA